MDVQQEAEDAIYKYEGDESTDDLIMSGEQHQAEISHQDREDEACELKAVRPKVFLRIAFGRQQTQIVNEQHTGHPHRLRKERHQRACEKLERDGRRVDREDHDDVDREEAEAGGLPVVVEDIVVKEAVAQEHADDDQEGNDVQEHISARLEEAGDADDHLTEGQNHEQQIPLGEVREVARSRLVGTMLRGLRDITVNQRER